MDPKEEYLIENSKIEKIRFLRDKMLNKNEGTEKMGNNFIIPPFRPENITYHVNQTRLNDQKLPIFNLAK